MKASLKILLLLLLALIPLSCSKPGPTSSEPKTLYTCGMHPQIIQDHPGDCPICGMHLEPVRKANAPTAERKVKFYKSTMMPGEISPKPGKDSMGMEMVPVYEEATGAAAAESSVISIDPVTIQNMGIRTEIVTRGPLKSVVRTVGVIDYDETTLTDVTVKYKGWIEKLFVDSTGKEVKAGEPLFEIYSPDLVSAQNEYLIALGTGSATLKASALRKLKNFDVSAEQIATLERTRQIKQTLQVNALRGGIVVEKMAVQGQMVDAGMKLYRLADLSRVWVLSQVYEQDLPYVKLDQEAQISLSYAPDEKQQGRVAYIYPTLDEKTRTARVRIEVPNPARLLKPGMFAKVELTAQLEPDAVLVPDSAVLRSGEKNTAFVALEGGKFEPRTITLGPRGEGNVYQVIRGLSEGERVVTSGQFMLDSESQLKEAIQKMREPGNTPHQP